MTNNHKNNLNPVFIAYPAVYSLLMLNYLVYKRRIHFSGIVLSTSHIKMRGINFSFLESFYILWKKCGLYYGLYMFLVIKGAAFIFWWWKLSAFIVGKRLTLKTFSEISKEFNIPIYKSRNINNTETVGFMKQIDARILVSAYNNQILKYEICKKFKYHGINIHNSYLPNFSGLDSAFETIFHEVKQSGATIHYIFTNIDTGKILAQEKITVTSADTIFSLNVRQWLRGARMLPNVLGAIANEMAVAQKQDVSTRLYPYRSFPERRRIRDVFKRGRSLISLRDIFIPSSCIYGLFGEQRTKKNSVATAS